MHYRGRARVRGGRVSRRSARRTFNACAHANRSLPYEIIRLAGAAYLVYLGIHLLIASRRPASDSHNVTTGTADGSFGRGFLIGITNPKSAAFFSSLFATVLPASAPIWVYAVAVLIAGFVSTGWFSMLAVMFSVGKVQRLYQRARRWIDAAMGAVLTLIGIRLALSR